MARLGIPPNVDLPGLSDQWCSSKKLAPGNHEWFLSSETVVGRLRPLLHRKPDPTHRIFPTCVNFCLKKNCPETQPHPFVYVLSVAALALVNRNIEQLEQRLNYLLSRKPLSRRSYSEKSAGPTSVLSGIAGLHSGASSFTGGKLLAVCGLASVDTSSHAVHKTGGKDSV